VSKQDLFDRAYENLEPTRLGRDLGRYELSDRDLEVSRLAGETAYRRGLQQGLQLAVNLLEELSPCRPVALLQEAVAVAGRLRSSPRRCRRMMDEVHLRVRRRASVLSQGGKPQAQPEGDEP
jgi:hypothetical protein